MAAAFARRAQPRLLVGRLAPRLFVAAGVERLNLSRGLPVFFVPVYRYFKCRYVSTYFFVPIFPTLPSNFELFSFFSCAALEMQSGNRNICSSCLEIFWKCLEDTLPSVNYMGFPASRATFRQMFDEKLQINIFDIFGDMCSSLQDSVIWN